MDKIQPDLTPVNKGRKFGSSSHFYPEKYWFKNFPLTQKQRTLNFKKIVLVHDKNINL